MSRTARPYRFVAVQRAEQWSSYRIVYEGAGGGLLLSIVEVERSSGAVVIRALVTIGSSQVVEGCVDYEEGGSCRRCAEGSHLEEALCYADIAGCQTQFRGICVDCQDYALLVENRCIRECGQLCDTSKIVFYHNRHLA